MVGPNVGNSVHYWPGPRDTRAHSNGLGAHDPIAAIVTRVWDGDTVNLIIFPDFGTPQVRGSVQRAGVASPDQGRWEHTHSERSLALHLERTARLGRPIQDRPQA